MYPYGIHSYPAPKPKAANQQTLATALAEAIRTHDIKWARRLFDIAFWNNIPLIPNWHHLLLAASGKDRPMIQLLATHDARLGKTEARCLKELLPRQWPELMTVLRNNGIQVSTGIDSEPLHMPTLIPMTECLVNDSQTGAALKERLDEIPSLKYEFNRKLARDRFQNRPGAELLRPENFAAFLKAHQDNYYQASGSQVLGIVTELYHKYRNGKIPADIEKALYTLKKGGANFSIANDRAHRLSYYCGKKEPGLAKILMELDPAPAEWFLLEMARAKGELAFGVEKLYPHKKASKYSEFFFQIYVERLKPDEFIPQRGKITSYHEAFKALVGPQKKPHQPLTFTRHGHWGKF